ncbi:MAG: hypothetical protein IJ735_05250 [Clostridia bacterium]|nr:hypothetical protein [Clostridia bacterium]
MKKSESLLLAITVLTVILSFAGCSLFNNTSFDEAKENLKNAGYTVTELTGEEYVETPDALPSVSSATLERYVYAVKNSEEIHIFLFTSIDTASNEYTFMHMEGLLGGQNNQVVYFATKQARTDSKL